MNKYLIYKDEKSDKFWNIEVSEKSFTVTYGKTGTIGQRQEKTFENNETCLNEANKLIKVKTDKGYIDAEVTLNLVKAETTIKKNNTLSDKIENELKITLPKRLKTFYDSGEYKKYEGLYVYNLYGYTTDSKFKVKFYTKDLQNILAENEIEMPDDFGSYYLPFIKFGEESQFLGIDITEGEICPVSMWEHEDGKFHLHSDSLDKFLSKLLKKGEEVPFKRALKVFEKARSLYSNKKYKDALNLLNKAMEGLASNIPEKYEDKKEVGTLFNLRGICKMKTNDIDGAIEDYNVALICGYYYSGLNIISCYLQDKKEYSKALEFVAKMENEYLDEYCFFHVSNYKGIANIYLSNVNEAENIYKAILKKYSVSNPDNINKSIKDLKEIEINKQPGFEIAIEILKWFGPK
jgi:predicted DNA-binding WGR domain protein